MKMMMKRYFLLCPFLIFTSSLVAGSFSQSEYEIVKNWTNNRFWEIQINEMDKILCNALASTDEICSQKSPQEAREDIDYLKFLKCQSLIKQKFPKQLVMDKENLIKGDCVSIYEKYNNDSKFSNNGFSSDYITFAKNYSYSKFENSKHEKCLRAIDYKGCMSYENGNSKSIINTEEGINDCSIKWCLPYEIGNYSKDSAGLPLIKGYWFRDNPRSRAAYYISPILKLNVDNQYGRYIHMSHIMRFFENAKSGTSGMFIGGSATTTCYGSGSYLTCNSRLPTYIPGTPGKPSGVRQVIDDYVFDCDAEIFSIHRNRRLMRSEGSNGKKYKWVNFKNAKNNLITSRAIQFCNVQKTKINSLNPSGFTKYSDTKIKVK